MQFQFTRPRGARRGRGRQTSTVGVSIHAPTRGATNILKALEDALQFQFTRPRGARPSPLVMV